MHNNSNGGTLYEIGYMQIVTIESSFSQNVIKLVCLQLQQLFTCLVKLEVSP